LVKARLAADTSGSAAIAWHTPDDDPGSPSAGWLGVAEALATGEQALSSSVIQTAVERQGARDERTERLTRERSDIASQLAALGQRVPADNAIELVWYRIPDAG
jgi:enoyl reductase-like protein